MRGAFGTLAAGLCLLVLGPSARGETTDGKAPSAAPVSHSRAGAGPIATARRLIANGERAKARTVLEDALIDLPESERWAAVELLRECYKSLAREAEASGKRGEANFYRDNLAILNRVPQRPAPPAPPAAPPMSLSSLAGAGAAQAAAPPSGLAPKSVTDEHSRPGPDAERPSAATSAPPAPRAGDGPSEAPRAEPSALNAPEALPEPDRMPPPPRQALDAPVALAGPLAEGANDVENANRSVTINPASGTPDAARAASTEAPSSIGDPQALAAAMPATPPFEKRPTVPPATPRTPEPSPTPASAPAPAAPASVAESGPVKGQELDQANQLFRARRYSEAGRVYGALAAEKRLPADRRPHWAYCRAFEVVRRINARPRSRREWDAIDAEIRDIQRLTPGNWFGEYLRSHVAEARRLRRWPAARSGQMVVRGAEPDGPPSSVSPPSSTIAPGPVERSAAPARNQPRSGVAPSAGPARPGTAPLLELPSLAPTPVERSGLEGGGASPREGAPPTVDQTAVGAVGGTDVNRAFAAASGEGVENSGAEAVSTPAPTGPVAWHVHETANFRIYHLDAELARRAGAIAESVRSVQARRWGSPAEHVRWSPRCDIYLYPRAEIYARETGQPEMSPGISTMANDHVRVTSRRVNLRADNPTLLSATLPHEVAHIVLADLFVARVIPRWADEGIAVLAEPAAEQRHRVADLRGPLESGRIFKVGRLMTMDYPDAQDSRLFYAESVSLTRYLMTLGPPDRLIRFLHDAQRIGADAALKDVYQIEGTADLNDRWLAHARKENEATLASTRTEASAGGPSVRK